MFNEFEPKSLCSLRDIDFECAGKCKSWNIRNHNVLCRPLFCYLSECIPGLNFPGVFVSMLPLEPFVIGHHHVCRSPPCSCLSAVVSIACSWACTLSVFSCGKRLHSFLSMAETCVLSISVGRTSLAWSQLSCYPDFFPSRHCWETPFSAPSPQNHCAQEIGSWSSFPSFSFKLF